MVRRLIKQGAIAGAVVLGLEAAYAVLKPAPDLPEFDPSSTFGDPSLPRLAVAVLGDSSVTAPGVDGPEEIWVSIVAGRLAATHHVELKSFAVGGSKAHDLLRDQLPAALDFAPDVAVVSVGANDAIRGIPVSRFEQNLDDLVGTLVASGAKVVQSGVGDLGTIPRLYPPLRQLMSRRALRYDRAHWRVAARHGTVVVEQRSDDRVVWYTDRGLFAADHFHVSAAGHARWADTAWRAIAPLVGADLEPV